MKKRNICIYCETWESGGIESFLFNILQYLDMQRFSVDIVAAVLKTSVFTSRLEKQGVRFWELSGNTRNIFQNIKLFRRLMEQQKYDVVHLNIYQALSMCYAVEAKKAGVPVRLVHSHNTALRKSKTRLLKMTLHNAAKYTLFPAGTHFFACSEAAARFMFPSRLVTRENWTFVPNGIDTSRFCFNRERRKAFREKWNLQDRFVVGNIGRLCYQKNQTFLLDTFSKLKSLQPNSKLLLVGAGNDEQMLREQTRKLGLEEEILFLGTTSAPEEALWAMDVFAFPSRFEGLGIVAIEAQAAGLPVVCSEYVPAEVFVTQNIQKVSLRAGADRWARTLAAGKSVIDRLQAPEIIRQAGYDIADVAKCMAEYYGEENDV